MADTSQQNNPNQPIDNPDISAKIQSKELIAALKERLRLEGDYRDLLRDSIKDLNSQINAIDKMNSRIETMNRGNVNIKALNSEIKKIKESEYLNDLKMQELQVRMGVSADVAKAKAESYNKLIEDRIKKESDIKKLIGETDSIKDEVLKTDKNALKNADDYANALKTQRENENNLLTAQKTNDATKIAQAQSLVDHGRDYLNLLDSQTSIEAKNLAQKIDLVTQSEEEAQALDRQLRTQTAISSEEELAYAEALKRGQLVAKQTQDTEKKLKFEEQVNKNLGVSGLLMQKFSEKLGLGTSIYEAMTEKSRRLQESELKGEKFGALSKKFSVLKAGSKEALNVVGNLLKSPAGMLAVAGGVYAVAQAGLNAIGSAAKAAGNFVAGLSQHSANLARNLTAPITGMLEKIPLIGGFMAGIVDGWAAIFDLVMGVDDYIVKLGRTVGMSANESRALKNYFGSMKQSSGDVQANMNFTADRLFESEISLRQSLGVNQKISDELVKQNLIVQRRLGLDKQTADALANVALVQKGSKEQLTDQTEISRQVYYQSELIGKVTGVTFNYKEILKTASSYGGYLGLQFAKYPLKLTESIQKVKALGMDLQKLDGIADSFLDFESSISKEFEAQLLTGKDINLMQARNMFLNNDLAGAAAEITRQVGSSADFLNMNRIAATSLAEAMGMSRNEMAEFLKQQEILKGLGETDMDTLMKKLKVMKQTGDIAGINALRRKAENAQLQEQFDQMLDKSTLESFEDIITNLKEAFVNLLAGSGISKWLEGIVEWTEKPENIKYIMDMLVKGAATFVEYMGKGIGLVTDMMVQLLEGFNSIASFFGADIDESVIQRIQKVGDYAKYESEQIAKDILNQRSDVREKKVAEDESKHISFSDFGTAVPGIVAQIYGEMTDAFVDEDKIANLMQGFKSQDEFFSFLEEYNKKAKEHNEKDFQSRFADVFDTIFDVGAEKKINEALKKLGVKSQDIGVTESGRSGVEFKKFAEGGIVTQPTSAIIGETGETEAVIPLSRFGEVFGSYLSTLSGENASSMKLTEMKSLIEDLAVRDRSRETTAPYKQEVQGNKPDQDKNINIVLNSTIKTNDREIGSSSERYFLQYASAKIERSTGYAIPVGG